MRCEITRLLLQLHLVCAQDATRNFTEVDKESEVPVRSPNTRNAVFLTGMVFPYTELQGSVCTVFREHTMVEVILEAL